MADTNTLTLTAELMDVINAELLIQVDDEFLFYDRAPIQRSDEVFSEKGVTQAVFNRPTLPTGTYTETSRRLTDGTSIDQTGILIAMSQVTLTIREYAGPHDGTAVRPFSVSEFLKNRARHNIPQLLGEFLRRDRAKAMDVWVRDLLLAAAQVFTPSGDTEANLVAGAVLTVDALRELNKQMKDAKIPTYPDGFYRYMTNTRDLRMLKKDPEYREAWRYRGDNPVFRGHVGDVEGFHIMETTHISTKAVGAADAVTGYQGAAWGPYGLGHGVGMEPNARLADETDFQRNAKMIWKSEEAIGTLYSDLFYRTVTT